MDAQKDKKSDPVSERLIEENKRTEVKDTRCGIGFIHPGFIQPCANICCFTGYYSLAALLTSTLSSYANSQVTTLERQFGFSSKQTGIIMAGNDIGYLACVLLVSYSASKIHIPRSLGMATVIFGLSGIACSLPHFIFGAQVSPELTNGDANHTSFRPAMFGVLCDGLNDTRSCSSGRDSTTDGRKSQVSEHVATSSLVIIVIGMVLQGFGKAPRSTFTITYVDNNTKKSNTGFFMGIIITCGIFGPAVAYLLGGVFSSLYVTLEPTHLTPRHPKWIGAWWLGYLVFGLMALLVSGALFCFPRRMPSRHSKNSVETVTEKSNRYEVSANQNFSKLDDHSVHQVFNVQAKTPSYEQGIYGQFRLRLSRLKLLLKEFLTTLLKLWINPVYLCMAGSSVFLMFAISGASAYTPKYMETMFHLQTSKANYIIAGQALFSSCVGTFIGGYLSKRLKMTAMKALKFVLVVVSVAMTLTITGFVFQCDQPEVHNLPGSEQSCNGQCNCQDNSYFAICGEDGKTYYSPCSAGCSEIEDGVYKNCTCLPGGGQAYPGMCDYGCNHLYPYVFFSALRALFGTLSIVPRLLVFIRCVDDKDKSLAIGFESFLTSLLGWLLGPLVFGYVIDGICVVWDVTCGIRGRCLLYDNRTFQMKLHGFVAVPLGLSFLCLLVAYVYARWTKCLEGPGKDHKGAAAEMSLVVKEQNLEGFEDGKP